MINAEEHKSAYELRARGAILSQKVASENVNNRMWHDSRCSVPIFSLIYIQRGGFWSIYRPKALTGNAVRYFSERLVKLYFELFSPFYLKCPTTKQWFLTWVESYWSIKIRNSIFRPVILTLLFEYVFEFSVASCSIKLWLLAPCGMKKT